MQSSVHRVSVILPTTMSIDSPPHDTRIPSPSRLTITSGKRDRLSVAGRVADERIAGSPPRAIGA
jgi:hypothetical protein